MSTEPLKAAAIQLATGTNIGANLLEAEKLAAAAAKDGANLIVFPENFAFMGNSCKEMTPLCETDGDGPLQDFLSQTAKKLGVWLVGGTIPMEANDASKMRAACLLYNAQGERVARYDKAHLFDVNLVETNEEYIESDSIEPGDKVVVVDTPFGRLGLAVCYDLRFPELFRAMLDKGAEIITLPSAFTAITGKAHWEVLVRARAIENLAYVIASAQGGFHINSRETYGHSMIVDPWGSILAEQQRGNGYIMATLNPEFQHSTRRNFPCIDHRKLTCR